ncbi:MAG: PPC domain-containing DNA-binding protein [Candidatus Latescibacterota bacterium]
MQFAKLGDNYMIRLQRGEEVVETLTGFVRDKGIQAGLVSGIGAVADVTLGFFDPRTREYHKELLPGSWEVANITGNVALLDGEEMLHLHTTVADDHHNSKAGHLFSGEVSVTLEVIIMPFPGAVERKMDEAIGLNLLALG